MTPFPPERVASRSRVTAAGRRAFHALTVRLELARAGFTRAERKTFLAAWDKPDGELTLDEAVLLHRHFTRDWGVTS